MNERDFYLNCAINAMQGMLEAGGKLGMIAELLPKEVAERAFKFADAMLEEYNKNIFLK